MFPGAIFRVRTTWDAARTPVQEHESWGFDTSNIVIAPRDTMGNYAPPTLAPWDSVIAVLMGTDDVSDAILQHIDDPTVVLTVAAWMPPPNIGTGLTLWARCGAYPDLISHDRMVPITSTTGAYIGLGYCSTNWYISVTNTSSVPRTVRAVVGAHSEAHTVHARVGIDHAVTSAQEADLRERLSRHAWRFFSLSGGNWAITQFDIYRGAPCNGPQNLTACAGHQCNYCITSSCPCPPGRSQCSGSGIYVCNNDWTEDVLTHEAGHYWLGLWGGDEYVTRDAGNSETACSNSIMATTLYNQTSLCSAAQHRASTSDRVTAGQLRSIFGIESYWTGGSGHDTHDTSAIDRAYANGTLTFPLPAGQAPNTFALYSMVHNSALGLSIFH